MTVLMVPVSKCAELESWLKNKYVYLGSEPLNHAIVQKRREEVQEELETPYISSLIESVTGLAKAKLEVLRGFQRYNADSYEDRGQYYKDRGDDAYKCADDLLSSHFASLPHGKQDWHNLRNALSQHITYFHNSNKSPGEITAWGNLPSQWIKRQMLRNSQPLQKPCSNTHKRQKS